MTRFSPFINVVDRRPQQDTFCLSAKGSRSLLLGLLLLLVGLRAEAQKTWTGGTTNWNTASNWNPAGVPTAADNVVIPSAPANDPIVSTTVVANSVEVQSGASLSITSGGRLLVDQSKPISGSLTAFYNSGTLSNQGQLVISAGSFSFGDYGIRNLGTITNRVGGIIAIEQPTIQPNSTCFFNDGGTVNNEGQVLLGTAFNSTFPSNSSSYSIRNTGNFMNKTGGVISTDRSFVTSLFNASTGTFTNAAQINIGIVRVQTRGIENQGTFNNNTGGVITIGEVRSPPSANGIVGGLVNTGGTFTNAAQIIMGQTLTPFGNQGSGLVNQATFVNNSGGAITIDQVSGAGIVSLNGGNFTNEARITIGASTTVGTAIESQGESLSTFTNTVGGVITLDRAKTAGLVNRVANFTNEGKITIGAIAAVGGLAIQNSYLFDNSGCGALINVVSNDVITEYGGAITNSGTIIENSENVNQISSNTGIVQNNNGGFFYVGSGPNQPLSVSATNPTNCISPNGALTLTGLKATTSYTLSYTVGGSVKALIPSTNASGQFTIPNLGAGSYAITLSGSCVGIPLSLSATLTGPILTVSSPVTTVATLGVSFSQSFTATGGTGTYSFSQTAGSLPTGLSLSSTGVLSGTPTATGFYGIVVRATDASGCPDNSASTTYNFSVQAPAPDLTPTLYARPSTVYGNTPLTVVVDVVEINSVATSGLITVKVTKDAKAPLSFDGSLTTLAGRSIQNSSWSFASEGSYYVLTSSQSIPGGDKLSFGLSGPLSSGGTGGLLTVSATVTGGSGGESRLNNNVDADKVDYFQQ
ncbi:beta strand repeat-containing protein [Spirosoma validum]|uniref:Dystroglycan-type cadherin-like domain-containing protein n=1 Tax=Spirosoma validum TaxID=2771355 RepID=A0A927B8R1_9BACT|nr:Ig domain-containing protein [Spirosoma validum]MBD2757262.1 hypothetical protein [Spirosoma validum]